MTDEGQVEEVVASAAPGCACQCFYSSPSGGVRFNAPMNLHLAGAAQLQLLHILDVPALPLNFHHPLIFFKATRSHVA